MQPAFCYFQNCRYRQCLSRNNKPKKCCDANSTHNIFGKRVSGNSAKGGGQGAVVFLIKILSQIKGIYLKLRLILRQSSQLWLLSDDSPVLP